MIVKAMENTCLICGEVIPEGRQICPMCGTKEQDIGGKLTGRKEHEEFKVRDEVEQAFHEGYTKGFEIAMKTVCGMKQDKERLQREIAFLRAQLEQRYRVDDIDGEYE